MPDLCENARAKRMQRHNTNQDSVGRGTTVGESREAANVHLHQTCKPALLGGFCHVRKKAWRESKVPLYFGIQELFFERIKKLKVQRTPEYVQVYSYQNFYV